MAQSFEYPMFSPHDKAKLYKRYVGDVSISASGVRSPIIVDGREVGDADIITIQKNVYVCVGKIRWIESNDEQESDTQPVSGLIVSHGYMMIKTNTTKHIGDGDIIEIPETAPHAGMWIVTDGVSRTYVYTPKPVLMFATVPLERL